MNKMLSDVLRDYHGLREQLDRALLGDNAEKWGKAFRTFMRGEPTWAEGMIYPPLEWSRDLGEVPLDLIENTIRLYGEEYVDGGIGWRLPTSEELRRALRIMKPEGFMIRVYYWSSTPDDNGGGLKILYTHDGCGGICYGGSGFCRNEKVHLRLVRAMSV
jgi:hypothetical protein